MTKRKAASLSPHAATHDAWVQWMRTVPWTHFVTLTSNERSRTQRSQTPTFATSEAAIKFMRGRLREWDARINRAILGKHWTLKATERVQAYGVLEAVQSNPHWHLVVQLRCREPKRDFIEASEKIWSKLIPSGSVDVQQITSLHALPHYMLKSSPHLDTRDRTAFLPDLA